MNFLYTLAPTVLGKDSGRLQARAYVLGIAHPTGYPTYIMLGHLFTYLPFGDVAYRVNLSSAVYGAVALFLLYWLIYKITESRMASTIGTLAFAVSQAFWSQALIAEVYTMNAMFITAVSLALVSWWRGRDDKVLVLASLLTGLAMTDHMTSGLLIPSALILIALVDWRKFLDMRLVIGCCLAFASGLIPYIYLPIRASMHPPLNYNNPSTLHNFLYLVTGREWARYMWHFGPAELPARLLIYWSDLIQQYNYLLLVLGLAGFLAMWKLLPAINTFFTVLFALILFYALEYDITDVFVYFIPTYLIISIWMAMCVKLVLRLLAQRRQRWAWMVSVVVVSIGLLLLIGSDWYTTYAKVDQSDNYHKMDIIKALSTAPKNAVIIQGYLDTSTSNYWYWVIGDRRDLWIAQVHKSDIKGFLDRRFVKGRKVYALYPMFNDQLHGYYRYRKEGKLWRVIQTESPTRKSSSLAAPRRA